MKTTLLLLALCAGISGFAAANAASIGTERGLQAQGVSGVEIRYRRGYRHGNAVRRRADRSRYFFSREPLEENRVNTHQF